jgi:O-antigen/teichoic acid export membrane protein
MAVGKILYKSVYWRSLQVILSFFINLFLVRHFQSSISAEFYSFIYVLSLCSSFFTLGLDIGLNFFLASRRLSPRAARRIIISVAVLALLICLPLLAVYFRPESYPDISLGKWLCFAACQIAGVLLTSLSGTIFTAHDQSYVPAQYSFGINLALAALVFSMPLLFGVNGHRLVENLFFLYFGFSLLQGLILFVVAMNRYPDTAAGIPDERERLLTGPAGIRTMLRYSFMAFITNFIFFVGGRLCIYLLPYWVDNDSLGNYIQAYKLVEYLSLLASFLYYPFIALVAGRRHTRTREWLLLFLVRLSNTAVLLFCLLMLIVGRSLLPFVYGYSFHRMYGIFICFIPGLFPVCSSTFFTAYFYGAGRLRYNFVSGCIQLGTVFILFILLTRQWGVYGAAIAFSLAGLVSMAYDCIVFRKESPYRLRELFLARMPDWRMVRIFVRQWRKPA